MMSELTISLIIHNDVSHIKAALDSLYENTRLRPIVYVTVNSGQSPDIDRLKSRFPDIIWRVNSRPAGFASNHNAVLRLATTPYVALLNDDIYVHPFALDTLVEYLEAHPSIGLVGPVIQNPDGTLQQSAFNDPTLLRMIYKIGGLSYLTRHGGIIRRFLQKIGITRWLRVESLDVHPQTHEVPVIVGVSMVVRREAYLQSGLMDEDTILYGEEIGWHWRLRNHGWKIMLIAEARITHFNIEQDLDNWKLIEHRKGILNYFVRYRPSWQATTIRMSIILFHVVRALYLLPFNTDGFRTNWRVAKLGLSWKPDC